jgi:hypothetical protein
MSKVQLIDLAYIQAGVAWLLYDAGHPFGALAIGGVGVINYIVSFLEMLKRKTRDAS